jgi:hypothetical protein
VKLPLAASGLLVAVLAGCSGQAPASITTSKTTTPSDFAPPTFTYQRTDVTPWPWTVSTMTVTCTDTAGGATARVNGATYGITGREATHARLRGYANIETLLLDRKNNSPSDLAFTRRVESDCSVAMAGK